MGKGLSGELSCPCDRSCCNTDYLDAFWQCLSYYDRLLRMPFQLAWTKSRKSCCTTPGISVGGGVGVSKMLKFFVKIFYVMGKGLSGELSCPCDRSCCNTDYLDAFWQWLSYYDRLLRMPFQLAWTKSRKSCCTTPGISVGGRVGVSKMLKFFVKVFYVMGKALSGELSCPCDRPCFYFFLFNKRHVLFVIPYIFCYKMSVSIKKKKSKKKKTWIPFI